MATISKIVSGDIPSDNLKGKGKHYRYDEWNEIAKDHNDYMVHLFASSHLKEDGFKEKIEKCLSEGLNTFKDISNKLKVPIQSIQMAFDLWDLTFKN